MAWRSVLKNLTPPIIADLHRAGRPYLSWSAASKAASSYEDEALNAFKVARHVRGSVDGALLSSNLLYLTALASGKPDLSVVDFGGSTGDLGADFLTAFPRATYTVVENPTMVAMMKGQGPVGFACTPPAECDIFFSSGTLQCIEKPLEILTIAFASARRSVVLVRNSFADEDIYRVQRSRLFANGSGPIPDGYKDRAVTYPHRTIREAVVIEMARQHGFRCVTRIAEAGTDALPYAGKVYGTQLVFLR
jgi:putative methyltransferase (TIGR04325 family)